MEKLLHYTWRHKMFPLGQLIMTDGRQVEIVDAGLYNRTDAGPDFFNAKIKVDGLLWVGNIEMHIKASDWYRHHHDTDHAYDNVVLHVVTLADMDVATSQGKVLPTLVVPIADTLKSDYETLLHSDKYPPCYKILSSMPRLKVHGWIAAMQTERLERKTNDVVKHVNDMGGSWDDGFFASFAHCFGFGVNGDAFDVWARQIPLRAVDHHRDNLFQVEAMFLGQAGLLAEPIKPALLSEGEQQVRRWQREYAYLQKKFGMEPMDASLWRYMRTRPQNFPHKRLLQLAQLHHERRTSLSSLLDCHSVDEIGKLYDMKGQKLDLVIINACIPTIFAYGRHHGKENLCIRAFDLLDELKAEDNTVVRMWKECGLEVRTAADSQGLLQLKKEYCDKKECLRCRFGYEFLSGEYRQAFLHENE